MGRDEIYILKHKDLDVAMVKINPFSGRIEYVLEVYMPEELPVGCAEEGSGLAQWWNMRAVPDTRKGIQQQLKLLGGRDKPVPYAGGVRSEFDGSLLDAACFEGIILEEHKFL